MFFMLAARLPAYQGVLAARLASEKRDGNVPPPRQGDQVRYESGSRYANRASTAASAPPATAAQFADLNTKLGGQYFAYRKLPPAGGDR